MDPFTGMSQDEMQKLDEVLQSEHAKALLRETTGKLFGAGKTNPLASNDGTDVSVIMNTSMESLSSLSDLDSLEPTISVPNDVDVVNIAKDIFRDDLPKCFDVGSALVDHTYSKLDLLNVDKPDSTNADLYQKVTGVAEKSFDSTRTNSSMISPPVRRSRRQLEKVEREQKELVETAEVQHHLYKEHKKLKEITEENFVLSKGMHIQILAGTNGPNYLEKTGNPVTTSESKSDTGFQDVFQSHRKVSTTDVSSNNIKPVVHDKLLSKSGSSDVNLLNDSSSKNDPFEDEQINAKKLGVHVTKTPEKMDSSDYVSNNLTEVDPPKTVENAKMGKVKSKSANETSLCEEVTSQSQKPVNSASPKTAKTTSKNLIKNVSEVNESSRNEESKIRSRRYSTKRTNKCLISEEKIQNNALSENKLCKGENNKKETTMLKNPRKKSLSFSEDKVDNIDAVEVKKRHLSVSEKDPSALKNVLLKPKLKPKKKFSRSESITADLLGPALFSEPDVMVKVKTNDDVTDSKKEKNVNQDKVGSTEKLDLVASCAVEQKTEVSELDLIKAEVQLEQKEVKQDSVVLQDFPEKELLEKSVKSESKVTSPKSISTKTESGKSIESSNSISLKESSKDIKATTPNKQLTSTNPVSKPTEVKPQRATSVRSQKCSPANIKDFLATKNKKLPNSVSHSPGVKENVTESVRAIEQAVKEGNEDGHEPSSRSADVDVSPKPERKSKRNIQRKRQFDEDYSPERNTRRKKAQVLQNPKNENQNTKTEPVEAEKSMPKRETRRASRLSASIIKAAKEEEEGDSDEEDDPDNGEASADSEDSEWDSEDDPEKLWCICRKPHNNKFMIQCDKCEDWFHGTCVSVTRQLGRQLEKDGKEWICPNCMKCSAVRGRGNINEASNQSGVEKAVNKHLPAATKDTVIKQSIESVPKNQVSEVTRPRRGGGVLKPSPNSKVPESTKEVKNLKISPKIVEKVSNNSERMLTRKPIPKDFVLKSRDPLKDRKKDVSDRSSSITKVEKVPTKVSTKDEKTKTKTDIPTEKVETPAAKSTNKAEKHQVKVEKASKPSVRERNVECKGASEVSNLPGKQIRLRELTVVNNVIVKERSVVAVRKDFTLPLEDNAKKLNPENFSRQSIGDAKTPRQKTKSIMKPAVIVKDTQVQRESAKRRYECIVCSKIAPVGSIYCSASCLEQYAAESVKIIQSTLKPTEDLNSAKAVVIDRESGNLISGVSAPTISELATWLQSNKTFEVVRPSLLTPTKKEQQQNSKLQQSERSDSDDAAKESVRLNVRKTLKKILFERCQNADDVKMTEDEVQKIATKIEEELHHYFKDNTFKYRTKYRSLMFNIKDPRNQGLFRKILKGKIPPDRLVRMSTEELASVELAKWREQENQHSLDMIKRMQIEQLQGSAGVRKKTHKGEIEIEEEAIGLDAEIDKEVPKTPPRPVEETIEVTPEKKEKKEECETEKDTTSLHRSHLFDLNCKICTGKMAPPPPEEPAPKKIRVAHCISVEQTSPKVSDADCVMRGISGHTPVGETSDDSVDREPSSTTHSSPDSSTFHRNSSRKAEASVWKGFIFMQDVAKFVSCAYKVSGPTDFLQQDIPDTIQVCGRIVPDQVWEYLSKIKQSGNKELIIICFRPANEEEASTYTSFYTYLNSRKRCGVVNNTYSKMIKDFYILPLASHKPVPTVLMPFDGPGLPSHRPHLLLGVLVRHRLKQKDMKTMSKSVQEKSEEGSYTPPMESSSYTPPLESHSYTPPLDSCTYTPPPENQSYTPPLEERSYTPPLDDQSYTPPLGTSPCPSEISSTVPVYNPTRSKNFNHATSSSDRTSPNFLISEGLSDDEEEYEPSYTPPLEKMPKMESEGDEDREKLYNCKSPVFGMSSFDTGSATTSSARNVITELMKRITDSSTPSSHSPVTTSVSSSSDLERQKMLLNELTRKVEETDRQVNQSLSVLKQLGAEPSDIDIHSTSQDRFESDNIVSVNTSGMSSFLNLPTKNLQEILNSVRPKVQTHDKESEEAKGDVDIRCRENVDTDYGSVLASTKDTDIRSLPNYSPIGQNAADSQECSMTDVDERGSSLGGTPPPCDDDDDDNSTASELRPSDPRIKIRTNFEDDCFASGELKKSSLSDMSMSELVERAEKELEAIESPSKNANSVGHYPVPSWENHKEPPPPGIDPSDLPPIESVSFSVSNPATDSSTHAIPAYPPQQSLPESHVIGPPFVPSTPPTPSTFPPPLPPPGFPIHTPPPNIDIVKAFPPPNMDVTKAFPPPNMDVTKAFPPPSMDVTKAFPPPTVLPPAFMPPPSVPPPPIPPPPPDGIDQRDEHYYPWPPEGPPPDIDYRDRPPHWDEREWGDWDHRPPYDHERGPPPPDYYHEREPPEDWHFGRYGRSFHPEDYQEDRPPWQEEEWSRDVRYEGRRPRRWYPRHSRGGRQRDDGWRGRRRIFSRPPRE